MLEQRIQQQFFESADLKYHAAEVLVRPVAEAVQAVVAGFTAGGRLLVAGSGPAAGLAQVLVAQLLGRFERDRPGLAAMALPVEAPGELPLARQVDTLGQPGDLLLLIDPDGESDALRSAAFAALDKDMTVIALAGRSGSLWREVLGETDVVVAVPHERRARVLEAQLLVLHCLCDAIDLQLLGEQDTA